MTLSEPVADAYFTAHDRLAARLALLAEAIEDMPAPNDPAVNWGHVGDLNEAHRLLGEVARRLGMEV